MVAQAIALRRSFRRSFLASQLLVKRLYRSTSWLDHLLNLLVSGLFLLLFAVVPFDDKFHLQTSQHNSMYSNKSCLFASVNTAQQHRTIIQDRLSNFYRLFSQKIYLIERRTFDFVEKSDDLVVIEDCRWQVYLNLDFDFNETFIDFDLKYFFVAKKIDLTIFDQRLYYKFHPEASLKVPKAMEHFKNSVIFKILELALQNQTISFRIKMEPMDDTFLNNMTQHLDLIQRLIFLFSAFGFVYLRMIGMIWHDMQTKFVTTLSLRGIGLLRYLVSYLWWTLLSSHLLLTVISCAIFVREIHFEFSVGLVFSLVVAHLLLSFDLLISAVIWVLFLRTKGASRVAFCMNLVLYNLAVIYLDPQLSYNYLYDQNLFFWLRVTFSVVPGLLFEWLLFELIEHSAVCKVKINRLYSTGRSDNLAIIVSLLLYYLAVVLLKVAFCWLLNQLSNHRILSTLFRLGQFIKGPLQAKASVPSPSPSSPKSTRTDCHSNSSDSYANPDRSVILKLNQVNKSIPTLSVQIESLSFNIRLHEITVLFALKEDPTLEVICELCAGLCLPDSGTVQACFILPSKSPSVRKAKASLILTDRFQLSYLTVEEYLYFFIALQDKPTRKAELVINETLSQLGLAFQRSARTENLTSLEQSKLALAISLVSQDDILVLHNPCLTMPLEDKRDFWDVLVRLKLSRSIFLATNNIDEADYIGDKVYLFQKGSISYHGTPKQLKDTRNQKFSLKISKLSEMSSADIESLVKRAFPKMVHLRDSLNEYHFAFNCDSDEENDSLLKLIDILQQKMVGDRNGAGSGLVVVNSIAMITMDDVIEDLLGQQQSAKSYDESNQTDNASNNLSPSSSIPSMHRFPYWYNLWGAVLFRRISAYRHRPQYLLPLLIGYLIGDLHNYFLMAYLRQLDTHHWVDTDHAEPYYLAFSISNNNNVNSSIKNSSLITSGSSQFALNKFCPPAMSQRCSAMDANQSLYHWIFRKAISFHEFARYFFYYYEFSGPEWSGLNQSSSGSIQSQQSSNLITVLYNPYTNVGQFFALVDLVPPLIQHYCPNVTMHYRVKVSGRYPDELSQPEMFIVSFIINTLAVLNFVSFVFLLNLYFRLEFDSGFYLFQAGNGVPFTFYWLANLSASSFLCCFCILISYVLVNLTISVELYAESLTAYIIFFYGVMLHSVGVACFAFLSACYIRNHFVLILVLCAFLGSKYISLIWTYSGVNFNPALYLLINLLVLSSPSATLSTILEKLFIKVYDLSETLANSSNFNLQLHYRFFWQGSFFWLIFNMTVICCVFSAIYYNQSNFSHLHYRLFELQKVMVRTTFNKDMAIIDENLRIEQMVRRGTLDGNLLMVHNLCKYSKSKMLDGISFLVPYRQCFGILGLCGAGKSELLRILAGQSFFDDGNFFMKNISTVNGENGPPRKLLPGIGYCPQKSCINDLLTLHEMLIMFAKIRGVPELSLMAEVEWISKAFKIESHLQMFGSRLPDDIKRKLTLAMTFIGNPILVLLDEPTNKMDQAMKREIWESLRVVRARYHSTIVLATNQISELEACCDRVAILIRGGFRYIGTEQKLRKRFCRGILLYLKIKPSMFRDIHFAIQLRKEIVAELPKLQLTLSHKYILHYYMASNQQDPCQWSTLFHKLDKIRKKFELETFSMTIGSLDQMFYLYSKKYHDLV